MKYNFRIILAILFSITGNAFAAGLISPPTIPLETGGATGTKPNIMYLFDDSGSMAWDYMGDEVNDKQCKSLSTTTATTNPKGTTTSGSNIITSLNTTPSTSWVGGTITGNNIPSNTTILSVDTVNKKLNLSNNSTGSGNNITFTITYSSSTTLTSFNRICASQTSGSTVTSSPTEINLANSSYAPDVPFMAHAFNKIYYNPSSIYRAGVDYQGNSLGDQSISSTKPDIYNSNPNDSFSSSSTVDLTTALQETYFCTTKTPTTAQFNDPTVCKRNGVNTTGGTSAIGTTSSTFNYFNDGFPNSSYPTFQYPVAGPTNPHYYNIIATDYCSIDGVTCSSSSSSGTAMPVRWCLTSADATSATVPTGKFTSGGNSGKNICQAKRNGTSGYIYPRYGNFQRVNLATSDYTNFANWYTYYRTRINAIKTSIGLTFANLDNSKRVGFITINPGTVSSTRMNSSTDTGKKFLPVTDFNSTQRQKFYSILYQQQPGNSTPLREALSRVGRYYAGKTDGINSGMISDTTNRSDDPVQYSCQQNFTILSTDGYWNGNSGDKLDGTAIADVDNTNTGYATRSSGSYDGNIGASGSLSDVAMYYYQTDLRPVDGPKGQNNVDVSADNVPISLTDNNNTQHMSTYAISLGLDGLVRYSKDYLSGGNTDFNNIKSGSSGACSWTTGTCNWPLPAADKETAIDDLWHATVNGRGKYFSAQNVNDIVTGLQDSLNTLMTQISSSASAATSSPNITSTDNYLFYTTYRTAKWDGDINAKSIDPTTGAVSTNSLWSARTVLNGQASASSDSRTLYYVRNSSGSSTLRAFNFSNMNSTEQSYFTTKCSSLLLSQCSLLNSTQKTDVDGGDKLVNYLRGQRGYEVSVNSTSPYFRDRDFILGDIIDTSPVYVGASSYSWSDIGYQTFSGTTTTRQKTLYVGANDGMLHALNATTGQEMWAIFPSQIMANLWKLADTAYPANHTYFVNGSISVMDTYIGGSWKTVLIAGTGQGGKGYIAIDITNPNSPSILWEICSTSVCSQTDSDFGYTMGNPIITKRAYDGKWVAYLPAGYDNPSGKGLIYEVDIANGAILRKLYTGTGTSTPYNQSGIAKINSYYENFNMDNTAKYLYAGDLNGAIWKWDLSNSGATTATQLGTAKDASGNTQPITTKIEVGTINGKPVLFIGTGQYLNFADYSTTGTQTVYAIKDTNTNYGNLRANNGMVQQTMSGGSITSTVSANSVNWDNNNGWYLDLASQLGERVNIDSTLALGTLNVVSNVPGNSTCTAGGNAWIYQINFMTGGSVSPNNVIGVKSTGGLVVGQVIAQLNSSGTVKNYITDASGGVNPSGVTIKNGSLFTNRSAWRQIYQKNR